MARLDYDAEADVLYVALADKHVARTVSLGDLRNVDYAADGTVVGIEFICASGGVDLADIPFSRTVGDAIANGDLGLPVFA